jgi:hypothetical protein
VERGLLAGGAVEERVEIVGRVQFAAVDGEQVFALLDVDAGQGERRGQAGRPVLPAEDFGDAVAAVFDGKSAPSRPVLGGPLYGWPVQIHMWPMVISPSISVER